MNGQFPRIVEPEVAFRVINGSIARKMARSTSMLGHAREWQMPFRLKYLPRYRQITKREGRVR